MSFMAKIIFSSNCSYVCLKNQKERILSIDFLYFRYIRIVGTHNTVNKVFHLVSMEVYYMQKQFALVEDIHGLI